MGANSGTFQYGVETTLFEPDSRVVEQQLDVRTASAIRQLADTAELFAKGQTRTCGEMCAVLP